MEAWTGAGLSRPGRFHCGRETYASTVRRGAPADKPALGRHPAADAAYVSFHRAATRTAQAAVPAADRESP